MKYHYDLSEQWTCLGKCFVYNNILLHLNSWWRFKNVLKLHVQKRVVLCDVIKNNSNNENCEWTRKNRDRDLGVHYIDTDEKMLIQHWLHFLLFHFFTTKPEEKLSLCALFPSRITACCFVSTQDEYWYFMIIFCWSQMIFLRLDFFLFFPHSFSLPFPKAYDF